MRTFLTAILAVTLLPLTAARAEVKLAPIFSDGMVLQREAPVPVWGTAVPDEPIMVTLAGQDVRTKAGADGSWKVVLAPLKAGGPLEMRCRGAAPEEIVIKDILAGDVWVCAGQSNMWWQVARSTNGVEEAARADYPQIRLFTVPQRVSSQPTKELSGRWSVCSPATIRNFSGVGYFFGREIHEQTTVPIGLINCSVSGTPIEAYINAALLEADPGYKTMMDRWQKIIADYPAAKAKYDADLAAWKVEAERVKADGGTPARAPLLPQGPESIGRPGVLYNAMVYPLMPFAIKGVAWYQGESNSGRAYQYRRLFPLLINSWRDGWGQGDFPFVFVQLPNFGTVSAPPGPVEKSSNWAELREAQAMTLSVKNTAMAVTIDIGTPAELHPLNKKDVGYRLALAALGLAYGRGTSGCGPVYRAMSLEKNAVRISFRNPATGLIAADRQPLTGFTIAGADKVFVWADAVLDGDTVIVSSPAVAEPKAVRYAWGSAPVCNLAGKNGLPAAPFRTDDWPGATFGVE